MADGEMDMAMEDAAMDTEESLEDEIIGSTLTHTVDEIPELANMNVGDVLTLTIAGVSDDGKSYNLQIQASPEAEPMGEAAGAPPIGGREAVAASLM